MPGACGEVQRLEARDPVPARVPQIQELCSLESGKSEGEAEPHTHPGYETGLKSRDEVVEEGDKTGQLWPCG